MYYFVIDYFLFLLDTPKYKGIILILICSPKAYIENIGRFWTQECYDLTYILAKIVWEKTHRKLSSVLASVNILMDIPSLLWGREQGTAGHSLKRGTIPPSSGENPDCVTSKAFKVYLTKDVQLKFKLLYFLENYTSLGVNQKFITWSDFK